MRGSEWAPLYLLVVLAIAAILLVTFVKPLFRQAAVTAEQTSQAAKDAAKSLVFVMLWPAGVWGRKKENRGAKTLTQTPTTNTPLQFLFLLRVLQHLVSGGR